MRGDLGAAQDRARQLDSMVDKHGNQPADVFVVASVAATVWTELGDVTAAFAAIDRATAAARTPDEQLRIRLAHARALARLRWDPEAAAAMTTAALGEAAGAAPRPCGQKGILADPPEQPRCHAAQRAVENLTERQARRIKPAAGDPRARTLRRPDALPSSASDGDGTAKSGSPARAQISTSRVTRLALVD